VSLAAFTLVFAGLFWLRYSVELAERAWQRHEIRSEALA